MNKYKEANSIPRDSPDISFKLGDSNKSLAIENSKGLIKTYNLSIHEKSLTMTIEVSDVFLFELYLQLKKKFDPPYIK